MESWFRVDLPANDRLPENAESLLDMFDVLYLAAYCPPEAAVFVARHHPDWLTYYLSPHAAYLAGDVIEVFNGKPSDPPSAEQAVLVEGHDESAERLLASTPPSVDTVHTAA